MVTLVTFWRISFEYPSCPILRIWHTRTFLSYAWPPPNPLLTQFRKLQPSPLEVRDHLILAEFFWLHLKRVWSVWKVLRVWRVMDPYPISYILVICSLCFWLYLERVWRDWSVWRAWSVSEYFPITYNLQICLKCRHSKEPPKPYNLIRWIQKKVLYNFECCCGDCFKHLEASKKTLKPL